MGCSWKLSSDCLNANMQNSLCIKIQHNVLHSILCSYIFLHSMNMWWICVFNPQKKLNKKSRVSLKISGSKQTRIEFESKTSSSRKVHYSRIKCYFKGSGLPHMCFATWITGFCFCTHKKVMRKKLYESRIVVG